MYKRKRRAEREEGGWFGVENNSFSRPQELRKKFMIGFAMSKGNNKFLGVKKVGKIIKKL